MDGETLAHLHQLRGQDVGVAITPTQGTIDDRGDWKTVKALLMLDKVVVDDPYQIVFTYMTQLVDDTDLIPLKHFLKMSVGVVVNTPELVFGEDPAGTVKSKQ